MVDGIKNNPIPYISNIDSAQEMYETLSKLFIIKNLGQIASLKIYKVINLVMSTILCFYGNSSLWVGSIFKAMFSASNTFFKKMTSDFDNCGISMTNE